MISVRDSETNLPRNIHDDAAFYETCLELPPARPDSEITQISFLIIKNRLVSGFARALEEMNSPTKKPYERVLELDRELREIYHSVPEYFKLQALSRIGSDPLPIIASRFMLANIHHKSLCVVHSRYLEAARVNPRYIYSRRACLESAMRLLSFQAIQHDQSSGNGGGQGITRYQTSLTSHDFLLGATIVCAELSLGKDPSGITRRKDTGPSQVELLAALERSSRIWRHMKDRSMEAYKASDVLGMLSHKFRRQTEVAAPSKAPQEQNSRTYSEHTRGRNRCSSHRFQESDSSQGPGSTFEEIPPANPSRNDTVLQRYATASDTVDAFTNSPAQVFTDYGAGLVPGQGSAPSFPPNPYQNLIDPQPQFEEDWVSSTYTSRYKRCRS